MLPYRLAGTAAELVSLISPVLVPVARIFDIPRFYDYRNIPLGKLPSFSLPAHPLTYYVQQLSVVSTSLLHLHSLIRFQREHCCALVKTQSTAHAIGEKILTGPRVLCSCD